MANTLDRSKRIPRFTFVIAAAVLAVAVPVMAALTIQVGDTVADFSAPDQDGQTFTLSAQSGKVVLLHVCAIWCGPCQDSARAEADLVAAVDAEIGSDNWVLVDALIENNNGGPTTIADANLWRDVLGTPALTLHANGGVTSGIHDLVQDLGVMAFPSYVIVTPDGVVSFVQEGFDPRVGNQPMIDAVVAAWYAYETPETQILDSVADLESAGGVGRALSAKLNAAYGLLTDDTAQNDHAVLNILRAVVNQAEAQSGKRLSEEQAADVIGIVLDLIAALDPA